MRWSDWYREFKGLAQQAGIPPEEYEGSTRQGDEYVAALFRDGETPQAAIEWVRDRQHRRARGAVRASRRGQGAQRMAREKTHPDVEFAVDDGGGHERTFKTWDEAAGFALSMAASTGESVLDVLLWSEEGAEAWGGDDAAERYREDPEASVFERIEIRVNMVGSVP